MLLLTAWIVVCGQSVNAKLTPSKFFALAEYSTEKNAVQSLDVPSEDGVLEERSCQEETVHTDVLGTPRKITRASDNALVWTWLQDDPWGGNLPTGSLTYNLRYAGQYYDSETGLHENRYRYYDPKTGRYTSPDPIGLVGGMHRYNYTAGDPVNATDPMGLCPMCIPAMMLRAGAIAGITSLGMELALNNGNWKQVNWWSVGDAFTDGMMFGMFSGSKAAPSKTCSAADSASVWSRGAGPRGQAIEQALGQNLPSNFPVIDKFIDGTATSIKSIDLGASSYQNASTLNRTLTGYIDKVANYNGTTAAGWAGVRIDANQITSRGLDLAIPNAGTAMQQQLINQAIQYGSSRGVQVNAIVYP